MKSEFKKIIVCRSLSFVLWICPDGDFKHQLALFLVSNIHKL